MHQRKEPVVIVASCIAAIFACVWNADGVVRAAEPKLDYQKADSRQATYEAALRSAGLPVFGVWRQVGPFDPLLRRVQGPDEDARLGTQYDLYGGGRGTWREMPDYLDGRLNSVDVSGIAQGPLGKQPTVYLRRTITVAAPTRIKVYLGADGHFIVTLNGKQVLYAGSTDRTEPGQESVDLPLSAGENVLLMEVKLAAKPCRFFFQPDYGAAFEDALYARLDVDFPTTAPRSTDFRARASSQSSAAEDRYYRAVEIEPSPGTLIEGGGLAFLPDGRLAVATRRGFVYLVKNPGADDPREITFQRFAEGLHEPLGLNVIDGRVLVVNRGEVTRLVDSDGDDKADRFECVSNDWGLTGNYHEYAYGLPPDAAGNLYAALNLTLAGGLKSDVQYRGCVVRITPQGRTEIVAAGLRSPNGIGRNLNGDVFVTDNQGDWVAACPLYHVQPGAFFGVPPSLPWLKSGTASTSQADPPRTPPAVWFPYDELCQSATDVTCDSTAGKFGPFAGQLFVGEMTKGLIARVALEKVAGQYQGACFLFRRGLGAVNRLTFGPDGKLYFARVNRGWGGGGLGDGLARLEFTGRAPLEMQTVHLLHDGFEITLTKPAAAGVGQDAKAYGLEQYGYHYWKTYGSPRIDVEPVQIENITWSPDRRTVRLKTSKLKPGRVCKLTLVDFRADDGDALLHADAFYTMNAVPE